MAKESRQTTGKRADRSAAGRKGGLAVKAKYGPEFYAQIGRKGGKEAHRRGTAHEWTPEEAAIAGRKGGLK